MSDQIRKVRTISDEDRIVIKAIAEKVKRLRIEQGYSYEGFAQKAGIHRITYYKFETGNQNFTASVFLKTIRGLGISIADFFSDIR